MVSVSKLMDHKLSLGSNSGLAFGIVLGGINILLVEPALNRWYDYPIITNLFEERAAPPLFTFLFAVYGLHIWFWPRMSLWGATVGGSFFCFILGWQHVIPKDVHTLVYLAIFGWAPVLVRMGIQQFWRI